MRDIQIEQDMYLEGAKLLQKGDRGVVLQLSAPGAGIALPQLTACSERYFVFHAEAMEGHSVAMEFLIYEQEEEPVMTIRFGILPKVETTVCIDLNWLDGGILFPESLPGELKQVCHGRRVDREKVRRMELVTIPAFHDITLRLGHMELTDVFPEKVELLDEKLVDALGQNKRKDWNGKTKSLDELKTVLTAQAKDASGEYPFPDWSVYGGWKEKKLGEGTGFFTRYKTDGKWWLADPLGYAFFSMGPDCVNVATDCRVDGVEKWLDWLPEQTDAEYRELFYHREKREGLRRNDLEFSYAGANLKRVFGKEWYTVWKKIIAAQLKENGMNTLGNWSDPRLFGTVGLPYVTSLPEFPSTKQAIFRDFPDVLSGEYERNAALCAQALAERKDDPYMIGYFLRNEPAWAFVDNLVLADEVLYQPAQTACKDHLIAFLKERYKTVEALNNAWHCSFSGFDALYEPQKDVSKWTEASNRDMREFSGRLLRAYVEIPSKACREVDPNHMILGMRWAWISDPDIVTGWENFDVFSINCYAQDPTAAIQNIVDLGVDLPVMLGEFHFGALDAGPTATGLEGTESQHDRGLAYRYYCERVAVHPNGVGAHYFQCYDQFVLGRFDGENYNIGLFDVCSRPYREMLDLVKKCSGAIYRVANGELSPAEEKGRSIPMIAY